MNRDEIMALANQTAGQHWMDEAHIQRFADLVYARGFAAGMKNEEQITREEVAAEREACARVCDLMEQQAEGTECCKWPTPIDCAAAIRERSNP